MPSLYNAPLKPINAGEKTHPYEHAAKLFLTDNFRLAPKQSFLYYVVINVNQSIGQSLVSIFNSSVQTVSSLSLSEQYEVGLMVKRIDLPRYTVNTKTYNAYNRKNIVTGSLQYDPITVSFHDDAADVVNKFWNDYYTYYYRDSDYQPELYQVPHKYTNRLRTKWGFSPLNRQLLPFLRDIQIFSLHNKRFTEYKLINPFITSWRHGEHDSSQDSGLMTNSMTVNFETVKYRVGTVNPIDVNGFAVLHYDNVQSPISTSTTNIYTNAGILGAIGTAGSTDLARPDGQGSGRGVLSNILSAYNLLNNVKNANFRNLANQTIGQLGLKAINGAVFGGANNYVVPTLSSTPGYGSATTMTATNDTVKGNPYAQSITQQSGPVSNFTTAGAAVSIGVPGVIQSTQSIVERGVETATVAGSAATSILFAQLAPTTGNIPINPATGQPYNIQTNTFIIGDNGQAISTKFNPNQSIGAFNPGNVEANSVSTQQITDGSFTTTVRTYTDGTRVGFDSNGNQLYVVPGRTQVDLEEANRQVNRALNVDTAAGVRYVTDPQTGLVTAVGGTSAQIGNTISQGVAGITGFVAGIKVYEALNKTGLGKSVFGQIVSASVSAGIGQGLFKITNNLVNPLINSFTGQIGAAWNNSIKNIQTSEGQWVGNGGYYPGIGVLNKQSETPTINNSRLETYKNGDVYMVDSNGNRTLIDNVGPANQQTYLDTNNPSNAVPIDSNGNSLAYQGPDEYSAYGLSLDQYRPEAQAVGLL